MRTDENYTLTYTPSNYLSKQFMRKLLLAVALMCDIVNFFVLISAFGSPLLFIAVAAIAVFATILRIFAGRCPYSVSYGLESGSFYIRRQYPLTVKTVAECGIDEIDSVDKCETIAGDETVYADISCQDSLYVVKLNGREYVLNLDLYMYSLLKELIR